MFLNFNNDLLFVVGSIIVGGIFTYTFYNNIFTTVHHSSNTIVYKEVGIQTEDLELVNTMPSLDYINEIAESTVQDSYILHQQSLHVDVGLQTDILSHVDVGIQTSARSLFSMFRDWLINQFHLKMDEVRSPANVRVEEWMEKLDPSQSIPSVDVISEGSGSNIQELVEVSDLMYDVTDYASYVNYINEVGVTQSTFFENGLTHVILTTHAGILSVDPNIANFLLNID